MTAIDDIQPPATTDGFRLFTSKASRKAPTQPVATAGEAVETKPVEQDVTSTSQSRTFADLGISQCLIDSLTAVSISTPTPVQKACIPPILAGKNVIASAKTGSGKTAAFALPILHQLSTDPYGIFALVLTPTRELAFQIAEQFKVMGEGINLRQTVVVGGMDMMAQALSLSRRPHVVIATPGRLLDLIRSSGDVLFLKKLRFLVLDEADRLLGETFADDLNGILEALPTTRQTLLFSATMTASIESLKNEKTFCFSVQERHETVEKLDQRYVLTPSLVRDSYFVWLLRNICQDKTVIVFTGKCKTCELVRFMLKQLDFNVTALHSQMTQLQRIASLARFRSGLVPILIATDVGSRGLDIPQVNIVLNYDVPCSATDYVHRVGRTARAGRGGKAVTLVTEIDIDLIQNIETRTGKKMQVEEVNEKEINEMLKDVAGAKHEASIHLGDIQFGEKTRINKLKQGIIDGPRKRVKKE